MIRTKPAVSRDEGELTPAGAPRHTTAGAGEENISARGQAITRVPKNTF